MFVFVLAGFVWLLVLQITVNRLQDQLDDLSSEREAEKKDLSPKQADKPAQTAKPKAVASVPARVPADTPKPEPVAQQPIAASEPAKEPEPVLELTPEEEPAAPKPSFEFSAAKLFSWIGGFMLFLGCVFGIKYVVENNLLSPLLRIVLSTGLGLILAVCGYCIKNDKYRVLAHTLLGSGIAIIYAALYCAHTFYHFMGITPAFILLAITSFAALGASLKKDAKYVGYLGAIIAFLTPILLNNGSDAWVAFFLYIFCINAAAAYAAAKKNWNGLLICTLSFTWLSQAGWLCSLETYKLLGVVLFFSLYALSSAWLTRRHKVPSVISYAVGGFLCMELLLMLPVGIWVADISFTSSVAQIIPSLEFIAYVLLVNGLILVLAGKEYVAYPFARVAKVLSFLILCTWMFVQTGHLPLWLTLGTCMLFAALNSGVELLLKRNHAKPDVFSLFYPVASMGGLVVMSILSGSMNGISFLSLFAVLALLLVSTLILAVLAQMIWACFVAVGLMFCFLVLCLFLGLEDIALTPYVLLSGLIPLFLCAGTFFALRRIVRELPSGPVMEGAVSCATALMPFVLILTVIAQGTAALSLHWILATTWVVCALTALACRVYKSTYTLPAAAVGAGIVQVAVWGQFVLKTHPQQAAILAGWSVALLVLFIALPFISRQFFAKKNGTWIACALSGLFSCLVGYLLVSNYVPNVPVASVPAVLLVIYAFLLRKLWGAKQTPQADPISIGFMSAITLFFLTLVFPLQIHSYWLSVAWAAEAVFLLMLYKRLPYEMWRLAGVGLLCVVSASLLLNDDFSPLPTIRIWNWYLWVYGLCAGALWMAAKLWEGPASWKKVFYTLFGCVLFWLLNIEIAHWFNTRNYLTFDFAGQVAQALTYTLAWALFGISMIWIGLRKQQSIVSRVGMGLMALTLLKFFFSDIWQLQSIYRILGLFGLAIMLIVASFWYQKKQKA